MEFTKEQQLFKTVINKAWEDSVFKQELVADPIDAIEKLIGKKLNLPAGKELVVKDQTNEEVIYINIPSVEKIDDVELNEEQLEAVAGGVYGNGCISDPVGDKIREATNTFKGMI